MTERETDSAVSDAQVVDIDVLLASVRSPVTRRSRRLRRRQWIVLLCLAMGPVSLSIPLGYLAYVRSDYYRTALEANLSERTGLLIEIGAVQPLGFAGRMLTDLRALLPGTGTSVFSCARALWSRDEHAPKAGRIITVEEGWILVGQPRWTRTEYERLLSGGLGHRFHDVGVSEVRLRDVEVRFEHEGFRFVAEHADGVLLIEPTGRGRASIDCTQFNGVETERPVNITAAFSPGDRRLPEFHELRVTVPAMPLKVLMRDRASGGPVTSGSFAGTIAYERAAAGVDRITISGAIRDADLSELTTYAPGGPYRGRVTVDVHEAVVVDDRLARLDCRGTIADLSLHDMAPALATRDRDAFLSVQVDRLLWDEGRIERLTASARCDALSLENISRLIGKGAVTGAATVDIRTVVIVDDRLRLAEGTVNAVPSSEAPATISREVIGAVAEYWFGVNPVALLPEQIEYLHLGARFAIEDDHLRLYGTHGRDGKAILTIKLFDQPIEILREPDRTFTVPDLVALLRERGQDVDKQDLQHLWERLHESPASQAQP